VQCLARVDSTLQPFHPPRSPDSGLASWRNKNARDGNPRCYRAVVSGRSVVDGDEDDDNGVRAGRKCYFFGTLSDSPRDVRRYLRP